MRTEHQPRMENAEVLEALADLWRGSGWDRLEISRTPHGYGGYCQAPEATYRPADWLERSDCPPVIQQLANLLNRSGWQRLEAVALGRDFVGGFCRPGDDYGIWYESQNGAPAAPIPPPF